MIQSIAIKNFTAHPHVSITNLPNINLIIGKNDTGKTGLLKVLYGTAKALEVDRKKQQNGETSIDKERSGMSYTIYLCLSTMGWEI